MFFFEENDELTEREIQTLYETHPYLIEQQFLNQETYPQYPLRSGFADIVVFMKNETVVIELKVELLIYSHLLQLNGYLEDIRNKFGEEKKIRGILIGREPRDDLFTAIRNLSFEIRFLVLNQDICTRIKICNKCRLANDVNNLECFYCKNNSFLETD